MASKINAINNRSQSFTIDPILGDSYVQFSYSATPKFIIGVDADDSDRFKISSGSALGTNDILIAEPTGEVLLPLQPAFLAYVSSTINSVTGDGTPYAVSFDTEVFDQGGDFSTTTFTAPNGSFYMFTFNVELENIDSGHTDLICYVYTSNRYYSGVNVNPYTVQTSGNLGFGIMVIADMDPADTAQFQIVVSNGTKTINVVGSANAETSIGGYLMG